MKLIRYVDSRDYFVMACEFIYMIFVAYYIVEEVNIQNLRSSYALQMSLFKPMWMKANVSQFPSQGVGDHQSQVGLLLG